MAGFSSGKTKIMADKMQPKIHKKNTENFFYGFFGNFPKLYLEFKKGVMDLPQV